MSSDRIAVEDEIALAEALPQADARALVDRAHLEDEVQSMYRLVAREEADALHFAVGRGVAAGVGYPDALLDAIPAEALASFAGVGYHLDLASLASGDRVLDLGSGSGTDVFAAAVLAGPSGRVVGVDFTDEQVEKARRSACGDRQRVLRRDRRPHARGAPESAARPRGARGRRTRLTGTRRGRRAAQAPGPAQPRR